MSKKNDQKKVNQNSLSYWKKKAKNCNLPIYKLVQNKMGDPLVLLNSVIDYYSWFIKTNDNFINIDLDDQRNRFYLDLFLFALSSSDEFANDFLNYYLYSIHVAYDEATGWDLDVFKNLLIKNKRRIDYDIFVMYMLIGANFDSLLCYVQKLEINKKNNLSYLAICELFKLTINQDLFDEIKYAIVDERIHKQQLKNQYVFKRLIN